MISTCLPVVVDVLPGGQSDALPAGMQSSIPDRAVECKGFWPSAAAAAAAGRRWPCL